MTSEIGRGVLDSMGDKVRFAPRSDGKGYSVSSTIRKHPV